MDGVVRRKDTPVFGIVDTGGITLDAHSAVVEGPEGIRGFERDILAQTEAALVDAAAVAFVVDSRDGLLPLDEHLAAHVRRKGLPTLCVVNKVDGVEREDELMIYSPLIRPFSSVIPPPSPPFQLPCMTNRGL